MKALVIVGHGSRRESSNEEIKSLCVALSKVLTKEYDMVQAGFLELAEPLIPQAIERCLDQGATEVKVLPYFLTAGRHVVEDVPAEVQKVIANKPNATIEILEYIGSHKGMLSLLSSAAC